MVLSFLLALFLAWPTFGLSLLAWFGWCAWSGYRRGNASKESKVMTTLLEPIFRNDYALFAGGLDLPFPDDVSVDEIVTGSVRTDQDMHQCGRLIMKYLAHNPQEAEAFIDALKHYGTGENGELEHPYEVLEWEFYRARCDGPLKLVSFRAVEALMTNNKLDCFRSVDLSKVSDMIGEMTRNLKSNGILRT